VGALGCKRAGADTSRTKLKSNIIPSIACGHSLLTVERVSIKIGAIALPVSGIGILP
jgi:hypothetical protein